MTHLDKDWLRDNKTVESCYLHTVLNYMLLEVSSLLSLMRIPTEMSHVTFFRL